VRVSVSEAALVDGLAEALRRCEFTVMRAGSHELEVKVGPARSGSALLKAAAELELDLYLKVWEAQHPGSRAARATKARA
jgi:hypothetical protein